MSADTILDRLRAGQPIGEPVAVVAAHFDDETFSLGGSLSVFQQLTLIHVTDGGHADAHAWRHAGLSTYKQYVTMRHRELEAALAAGGWALAQHHRYGVRDRGVLDALAGVEIRLRRDLQGMAAVFTHPYEGGHPDHDALAFLVARVVPAAARYEFASYHRTATARVAGRFYPHADCPAIDRRIDGDALRRKRAAVAAYPSQRGVAAWFDLTQESYRRAPSYDMTVGPPSGSCLYEQKGFLRNADWRRTIRRYRA